MGTRQHGDDATEAKRLGHTKRCAETTSSSLGLRVCGMQVTEILYQSLLESTGKHNGRDNSHCAAAIGQLQELLPLCVLSRAVKLTR